MARMVRPLVWVIWVLTLSSCQRAQQYPKSAPPQSANEEEPQEVPLRLSWMAPHPPLRDVPIVFVPSARLEEWERLPAYWNYFPPLPSGTGMRTIHLGLPPLQALASLVVTEHAEAIKIKVPLGLPDPTPYLPPTNPPLFRQWQLGRELFHVRLLPAGADYFSCAKCHDPEHGFAEEVRHSSGGSFNTPSLINVVYQRRQFWDGRVQTLEETLVRNLDDERPLKDDQARQRALQHHVWGGFVRELVAGQRYNQQFQDAFGVGQPTQDTVARALATYMRTLLSGDSLFDRANRIRQARKADTLTVDHFREAFDDRTEKTLQDLYFKEWKRDQMPALLVKGHALFQGKGRCSQCHDGPLFTDQDYHNVGYPDEVGVPTLVGKETGRSVHVPIGQKESRYIGAYRTPSLRNLVRSRPYFHDGSLPTLRQVIEFFDQGIIPTEHLAQVLKDNNPDLRLRLEGEDPDAKDALVMFLRSLEGGPVDPVVAAPPR